MSNHESSVAERNPKYEYQQSGSSMERQHAVYLRGAFKQYGTKKNSNVILNGLNMTVPKGCIYGLLGASGCGKTTLLTCIVGRRRLNSGVIWVLGGKPGSNESGVPGPKLGYMPQEIALNKSFTIKESIMYFGWINGMTTEKSKEKADFLINFLQLPSANRLIDNLSGGQQRRVSFACVLVHDPELIILDEPTVGVDPVLRENIWAYLVQLVKDGQRTIIITTHYIDETKQANLIGLMRSGQLLAEESPASLLQKYVCESLEEAFLKLSIIQNETKRRSSSLQSVTSPTAGSSPPTLPFDNRQLTAVEKTKLLKWNHLEALLWKNILGIWRNIGVLMFIIGLPIMQTFLFYITIGKDPRGLHLAVANGRLMNTTEKFLASTNSCESELTSCKYLHYLEKRKQKVDYYNTTEEAKQAVKTGKAWAALEFHYNFTAALKNRFEDSNIDEETISMSEINIWMDATNQQIKSLLQRQFIFSWRDFMNDVSSACNVSKIWLKSPVKFFPPIYGDESPEFTDFATPGVLLTIIFCATVASTCISMLSDRVDGILERDLVSGITSIEIMVSNLVYQSVILLFQAVMLMVFSFLIFNNTNHGFFLTEFLFVALTGFNGMCCGIVISCLANTVSDATNITMGSFLPIIIIGGILWPTQGMHPILKPFSVFMPLTLSTESLRSVMLRGWNITDKVVYLGLFTTVFWTIIFLIVSVLLLKFKK